jgi:branched-chain amino acid transport system substrate-binding protein
MSRINLTHKYLFILLTALAFLGTHEAYAKPAINVPIAIAAGFSGSGDVSASPYGVQLVNGVQLSLEWNKERLAKNNLNIELIDYDITADVNGVLKTAQDIAKSKAIAVVGYPFSSEALAAAPILQKAGISFISPGASVDRLKTMGRGVRAVAISNSEQGEVLASLALKKGARSVLIVMASDCAYCQDLQKSFTRTFKGKGRKIQNIEVLSSEIDFTKLASSLKGNTYDAIFLPNYEIINNHIITSFDRAQIVPKFYLGGDGWGLTSAAFQAKPTKAYVIGYWHRDLKITEAQKFRSMYYEKYNTEPSDMAVLAFDSMQLLIEGLLKTTSLNRDGVEAGLKNVTHFIGALGQVSTFKKNSFRKNLLLEYSGLEVRPSYLEGAKL